MKWISVEDRLPKEGTEVTVYMIGGAIRQVVKDKRFGGWKSPNCGGWQQETSAFITHWTRAKLVRPVGGSWAGGPDDAPWHVKEVRS
ncbi:MAG: hypothetical protein A2075_12105 [Geobacteraceae bacterium GWC2_58_44]|nr:MAG: hypothetical protein A2075_12105 [Geobacteraceae bacterium GWC2_58_44]HBG06305.1 hypothetical protein [Geobacter sp.]